jgi:hypothetical protein
LTSTSWKRLVIVALVATVGEMYFGFALFFAPGWANEWPFALTIHSVWAAGIALMLFVVLMTLGAGLGGLVGLMCSWRGIGSKHGLSVYITWLLLMATMVLLASTWMYRAAHAAALQMWPNGYPNR